MENKYNYSFKKKITITCRECGAQISLIENTALYCPKCRKFKKLKECNSDGEMVWELPTTRRHPNKNKKGDLKCQN